MLKHVALGLLLCWQLEPFYAIEDYRGGPGKVSCQTESMPPGFTCAIVFTLIRRCRTASAASLAGTTP